MTNQPKQLVLSKGTLVPVGLVVLLLSLLITGAVSFTRVQSDAEHNKEDIKDNIEKIEQLPSRQEFRTLQSDVGIIKTDIKTILDKI